MKEIKLRMLTKKGRLFAVLAIALMITPLVGLVLASSAMNPLVTYSGIGNPDNGTGKEGDLYVQLDTNVLWVFSNGGWQMFAIVPTVVNGTAGPIGPVGPQGPQGEQGPQGPAGVDGINGTNGIDGVNGVDGADGKDGTQIYNELMYTCTDDLGNDGDFFLFANGTLNVKIDGSWIVYGSLIGPAGEQGIQGETGATGPQGEQGLPGADGINGTDGATGQTGPMGPTGPQGATGETGPAGPAGADGVYYGADPEPIPDDANGLEIPWWIIVVIAGVVGLILAITVYVAQKDKVQ
jgi:hypothetical protein